MYFHEAIASALADSGIRTIFGVLGDANLSMPDQFARQPHCRYVSMSNEAGAVLAAAGYARTRHALGVATVTHGPALTNTATALVDSVRARTPLLLVAGDTRAIDRESLQNIPQRDVVLSTGAGFEQLRTPSTIGEDVGTAVRRAISERRPVVLNVPAEFQWQEAHYREGAITLNRSHAIHPDPAALDDAVGAIASATRPVVLAGRGATSPAARAALVALAERIGAPVATTLLAKDLFRGERCDLGLFGTLSHESALNAIGKSDCIIAFGASLNRLTTADRSLVEKRRLVQVDIDPDAIGRWTHVHAGVVGDSAVVASTMMTWLDAADIPRTTFASAELAALLAGRAREVFDDLSTDRTVDIRTAMNRLDAVFPRDRTLIFDGGRWMFSAFTRLHVPHPWQFVHTVNFGSIGLGMGSAIGAWFGAPDRPALLVTGDGGFMLGGLAEFNTAVRHDVDLVVVVFNDSAYGAEHIQFRDRNLDPAISTFAWPDFAPVATALGGRGLTVRNRDEMEEAFRAIESRDRPLLIDIKIDTDEVPRPNR